MTHRERWLNTLHFQPVDHVPDEEFGYWEETYAVWHEQGLPPEITNEGQANQFFGFAPRVGVPVNVGLLPGFEGGKILEETDQHIISLDADGVKKITFKDGHSSIPRYLEFPIKDWDSWQRFKERMDPDTPGRYPDNWDEIVPQLNASEVPVIIHLGSMFGRFRDWVGFENIAVMCLDQPDLIEDMVETQTNLVLKTVERAVREVKIDAGAYWEDICFNHGCIISPQMFREFLTPRYKRINDFVREHSGADIFYVDCDGSVMDVLPCFLEGGVNTMFPVEVAAGTDPVEIRRLYGQQVPMMGGVNKRQLIAGKEAIDAELRRLEPLVEEGGLIPHVDHRCPPDVTYENYLYYLKEKRALFGIPEPEPWEARRG
jgi:uroporphyrinogen decarboxylase